jgi:N-acetylglutamate synthase-like GNAT family acetyltransferase
MYSLRAARQEDAPAIRRLIWQVRINPMGLDWRRFWLAVDAQDQLLGCGQLKPHRDASVELASIAVQPGYRRQGIAQAIMEQLLAGSGRPVYLNCAGYLRSFYERFGFRVIGPEEMPGSFRRPWQWFRRVKAFLPASVPDLLVMKLD